MTTFGSQLATVGELWGSIPQVISVFHIKDAFDIFIVGVVIYLVLIFIKQTRSYFIFNSLIFLIGINIISRIFDLGLTRQLFQPLLAFFLFIFVLVFQREIRRFFRWFASGKIISLNEVSASDSNLSVITKAVFDMAKKKIGAIIVLPGEFPLDELIEGGFVLNGRISYPLIVSIFDSASPGHDGALLIENNMISRFAVQLPLAEDFKNIRNVGTRHRAAAGITERTDAIAIVVSEERGTVSISEGGSLRSIDDEQALVSILKKFIKENTPSETNSFWRFFLLKNVYTKIASFTLASIMWFVFVYQIGIVQQDFSIPIEFRFLPKNELINETSVKTVKVTLSGNNRDIATFDSKSLKLSVDVSNASSGKVRIPLSKEDISVPSYLEIVDFSPKEVRLDIIKNPSQ